MTNTKVKFYKFTNSTSSASKITTAKSVNGAIIWIVDTQELWIGGSQPNLVLKGALNVSLNNNNTLTINHYTQSGTTTTDTVYFTDTPSSDNKIATETAIVNALKKSQDSPAVYNTTEGVVSNKWINIVNDNVLSQNDTLESDLDKLDKKIAGLVDEVTDNEQVTQESLSALTDSVGLEDDMSLDLSSNTLQVIKDDTSVKEALIDLDGAIGDAGKIDDVKVNNTTIVVNKIANIETDGTYNSSTNKFATKTTVDNAIKKTTNSPATYNTQDISSTWATVITNNVISADDTFDTDINKLDNKIAGLSNELINNERVIQGGFTSFVGSIGLEPDMSLDLSSNTLQVIKDDTSVKEALIDLDGAMANAGRVNDVKINNTSIVTDKNAAIETDGAYNSNTNKLATVSTVTNAINNLDTQNDVQSVVYAAADSSNGAKLTFKGISETDGIISQGGGNTELQFAKIATTGAAADVSIADSGNHTTETTVEGAVQEIYTRLENMEYAFSVVESTDAASTPYGVTWTDDTDPQDPQIITGTLQASGNTLCKIYLVPNGSGNYLEYVTTKSGSNYAWGNFGEINLSLSGYVKTITINGKTYEVTQNSDDVNIGDVVTGVTGETAISGGETGLVSTTATTTTNSTTGAKSVEITSTVKIEEVVDGIVKDGTASYTAGHYVIENGKLVSAEGKSTGDTYTISANDGLVKASDVNAYINSLNNTSKGLNDLSDVNIATPTNNNVLKYNSTSGKWYNGTVDETDTTNTTGGDDTSSKIYLVGMTSQTTNNGSQRTYTQDTAYVGTDGMLYSGGQKVLTETPKIDFSATSSSSSSYSWSVYTINNRTYRYLTYSGSYTAFTVTPTISAGYDHYLLFYNNSSNKVDITLGTVTVYNNGSSSTASIIKKPSTISVASGKCIEISALGFVSGSTYAIITTGPEIG